jgi:lipid-binding SYLF domain-containing protein
MGRSLTTKTINKDIYAFIFNQKGLMAGLGLQGNKITRLND